MIELDIPGFGQRALHHLVLDYNGTLAIDGRIQPGVSSRLSQLKHSLDIHILTADTFGTVRTTFSQTDYTVHVLPAGETAGTSRRGREGGGGRERMSPRPYGVPCPYGVPAPVVQAALQRAVPCRPAGAAW